MTCLIKGCNFVLKNIPHEAFMYQKDSDPEFRFQTNHPNIFPYPYFILHTSPSPLLSISLDS